MRSECQGLWGGRCFLFLKLLSDSNVQLRQRATDLEAPNAYCHEGWLVQEPRSSYLTSPMIICQSSLQIVSALTWTVFNLQDAGMGKKSWLPQGVPCSNITLYCVGNGLRFRFPSGEERVWWWIISFQNTEFLYKSGIIAKGLCLNLLPLSLDHMGSSSNLVEIAVQAWRYCWPSISNG